MRVLIVGNDPVFATLLEDRLALSGHLVEVVTEGASAVRRAVDRSADLVVLELDLPGASGMEVLRALRTQPETRTLPVIMLGEETAREQRIEALRAGADDFVDKPCDLEELSLRIERLLGVQDAEGVALQGDLTNHPVWEVIQYIAAADKSGFLVVRGPLGAGRVQVVRGRVVAARFKGLEGAEAFLALAGLRAGRFRFVTHDGAVHTEPVGGGLPVAEILMQSALYEDELAQRRSSLPASGAPLAPAGPVPPPPELLVDLPLDAVHRRVRERPGLRLYDLLAEEGFAAPLKVRLAVAWLVERGALAPAAAGAGQRHPDTVEISSSMLLDAVVDELLVQGRRSGLNKALLSCLVVAAEEVWGELTALCRSLPGWEHMESLDLLQRRLESGSGGSALFDGTAGTLRLQVDPLTPTAVTRAEALVPDLCGMVVWLDRTGAPEGLQGVVRRLEERPEPAPGVVVAASSEAQLAAERLTSGTSRWQVIHLAPRSLLGLLRLLRQGRPEAAR